MIPVLSKQDALSLDKDSIRSNYISQKSLMENAGWNIANFIIENIHDPFNQKFIIIAGPGNNGGDAIICHHYLQYYGVSSVLLLFNKKQKDSWIFKRYLINENTIDYFTNTYELSRDAWYVDGIFGIGLKRNLEGIYKMIVERLTNDYQIISIDIPTGIYCDNGLIAGSNIYANITLAIGHLKLGHFFNDGIEASGELNILDVGFKPLSNENKYLELISIDDVKNLAPVYSENTNKYLRGKVLTISGPCGYTGACILATKAAIKTGAGLIRILAPESLSKIYEAKVIEAITVTLKEYETGFFSKENINNIIKESTWANSIVFGPGLNLQDESIDWMSEVLRQIKKPMVLDASGFLPLIKNKISINDLSKETILTPHYSEFSQIFNIEKNTVICDPISAVRKVISMLNGRALILKGSTNVILTTKGNILLMNHGSSSLATAGTGDVLSGIIGSLIAQGHSLDEASIFGTYLQAECVHQFNKLVSFNGLSATDLLTYIPHAIESIQYAD